LASIAGEKGGIIKPGVPVVSAPQPQEALDVLEASASERDAPLMLVGRDWLYEPVGGDQTGERLRAGLAGETLDDYHIGLIGDHQVVNAAVALAALEHVQAAGLPMSIDGIRAGLAQVDWPGRLEVINHDPLVVLDAAHNGASAQYLRTALTTRFPQRELALVFGASSDKDVPGMFEALLPVVDVLVTTQAAHPRALEPDAIAALAKEQGFEGRIITTNDIRTALQQAADVVGDEGIICTTGSLFVVGEARSVFSLPLGHVVSPPLTAAQPLLKRRS